MAIKGSQARLLLQEFVMGHLLFNLKPFISTTLHFGLKPTVPFTAKLVAFFFFKYLVYEGPLAVLNKAPFL